MQNLPITEEALKKLTYKKRNKKALIAKIKIKSRKYIKDNKWKKEHYISKQQIKITNMHEKLLDEGTKQAIQQLREIRSNYVSTERILFICEQSSSSKKNSIKDDDITQQSANNTMAYAALFNQLKEIASS